MPKVLQTLSPLYAGVDLNQFQIGCDPEFLLCNEQGEIVSGHNAVPGTKDTPFPLNDGAVQLDGVALELNTTPLPLTTDRFFATLEAVRKQAMDIVHDSEPGTNISHLTEARFKQEYWDALPDSVKEIGCDPDFDAYSGTVNQIVASDEEGVRFSGGHIHLSWNANVEDPMHPQHFEICRGIVKTLDICVGLPLAALEGAAGVARRRQYGKAGSFRPKKYGVEYRVPGNLWTTNEDLCEFAQAMVQKAVYSHTRFGNDSFGIGEGRIIEAINNDPRDADELFCEHVSNSEEYRQYHNVRKALANA